VLLHVLPYQPPLDVLDVGVKDLWVLAYGNRDVINHRDLFGYQHAEALIECYAARVAILARCG
jgi:hypothetical protein